MDDARLLERVRTHTGIEEEATARAMLRATLQALGRVLSDSDRHRLAGLLNPDAANALETASFDPQADRKAFLEAVAASEHLPEKWAVEHATAVLEALGESIEPAFRSELVHRLPQDLRVWLEPRRAGAPERRGSSQPPPERHRLADGRPGSQHPLSEAHPEQAQSGSVVRQSNPHANTKLSSSTGPTQVREHETLAEGKEPKNRPLSEVE